MNTATINSIIQPQKEKLLQHSLYGKVKTIEDLRHFLEGHVDEDACMAVVPDGLHIQQECHQEAHQN